MGSGEQLLMKLANHLSLSSVRVTETENNNGLNNIESDFSLTQKKSRDIQSKGWIVDARCHHEPIIFFNFLIGQFSSSSSLRGPKWLQELQPSCLHNRQEEEKDGKAKKLQFSAGQLPKYNFPKVPNDTLLISHWSYLDCSATPSKKTGKCSLLVACHMAPNNTTFAYKKEEENEYWVESSSFRYIWLVII